MRNKCKVIDITSLTTKNQIETEINTQLTKGWQFIQVFVTASKTFAIFIKTITD